MSATAQFLALLAVDLAGLVLLWFLLRRRIRRYLELDNLLDGVREESRALIMELNETADRNVSLVEDRIVTLRSTLDEVDKRMGIARRELKSRDDEREVFDRLRRRRPIVPESADPIPLELRSSLGTRAEEPRSYGNSSEPKAETSRVDLAAARELPPTDHLPEVAVAAQPIEPKRNLREEALDLYRKGFSADIIAARLGATVSEIDLLIDIEERRVEIESRAAGN